MGRHLPLILKYPTFIALISIAIISISIYFVKRNEGFVNPPRCPSAVTRDPNGGGILVQPSGTKYNSVADYIIGMKKLLEISPTCVIMPVPDIPSLPSSVDLPPYSQTDIAIKRQSQHDMAVADSIAYVAGIKDRAYNTHPINDTYDYDDTPELVQMQESIAAKGGAIGASSTADQISRDWSSYPQSAQKFAIGVASESSETTDIIPPIDQLTLLQSTASLPPDQEKQEIAERAAMKEYGPRSTVSYWETPLEEVQKLIDATNKDPHFTSEVSRVGPNQFEITKLIPVVGAPGASLTAIGVRDTRDASVEVARPVMNQEIPPDPLFEEGSRATGTLFSWSDFTKWTPGLERAFAPSRPLENWY